MLYDLTEQEMADAAQALLAGLEPVFVVERSDGMHLEAFRQQFAFDDKEHWYFNFKYPLPGNNDTLWRGTGHGTRRHAERAFLRLIDYNPPWLNDYDYSIVVRGALRKGKEAD